MTCKDCPKRDACHTLCDDMQAELAEPSVSVKSIPMGDMSNFSTTATRHVPDISDPIIEACRILMRHGFSIRRIEAVTRSGVSRSTISRLLSP